MRVSFGDLNRAIRFTFLPPHLTKPFAKSPLIKRGKLRLRAQRWSSIKNQEAIHRGLKPAHKGTFKYNLRFPGQYYQAETGLNQNYFRDYDPQTGRYVESDPIGLAGGTWSTFSYVGNNPISLNDRWGLLPGDPFSTRGAAANDALNFANPMSIAMNSEYAGLLYQDPASGMYYAMPPIPTGVEGNPAIHLPLVGGQGFIPVGDYHTHGNYCTAQHTATDKAHDVFRSDLFSDPDRDWARSIINQYPGWMRYLGTPSGLYFQLSGRSSQMPIDTSH